MRDDFARRWLAFDARRPTRPRLAKRFLLALFAMLACAALLAWLTAR